MAIKENFMQKPNKKKKVFLGGTCNNSLWREKLMPLLTIDYFNPVVENWTEEAKHQEIEERKNADYCLYVLTNKMEGIYSIAEVVDDSNKRPEKTIYCYIDFDGTFEPHTTKGLKATGEMIAANGATWCKNLEEVVQVLNQ